MRFLIKDKSLDKAERIQVVISYFLQLVIIASIIIAAWKQNWLSLFASIGILIFTFLPAIIRRRLHVRLPTEFEFITIVFIFLSLYLGEVHAYYIKFWWWDIILHTGGGFLFGILGFLFIYILNEEKKINVKLMPGFVALFAFAFAVMIGSVWEIFEFGMDGLFGLNMQKSGLVDTMWDLIVDAAGALIVAILGYIYVKKGNSLLFDRMIRKFLKRNRRLFKRKK
jgi:hypothetical protein